MTKARPRTYLDYNATSPLRPEARSAMISALDCLGNPSSVHAEGRQARAIVETAREDVAALLGSSTADVVFTSGATEANAMVMAGGWSAIIASRMEHDSVLAPARSSGSALVELAASSDGVVQVERLAEIVSRSGLPLTRVLVSIQLANNETGVLQPVGEVVAFARAHGIAVHVDAVQAVGRLPVDVAALGADYLSVSSHKIGGPKGVGALVLQGGRPLPVLIGGGGQERRRRAGTESVAAIAGFGAAARAVLDPTREMARVRALRDSLERRLREITPRAVIIGGGVARLGNTVNVGVPGASAEVLVIKLDLGGVAVSAGAACSSGKVGASAVLSAMDIEPSLARAAIRISLGWDTSEADLESFLTVWASSLSTADLSATSHARRVA